MTDPATPSASETDSPTGKRIMFGLFLVAVVVGGIWGWHRWTYARGHESTDNAQVDGHIVPVLPRVEGYISKVYVEDNEPVKIGDTLVTLDRQEVEARLAQAEADAAAARVSANESPAAALAEANARAAAAEADTIAASAELVRRQRDVERVRTLAANDVASREQLDAAEAAFRSADAALTAARSRATAARAMIQTVGADRQNAGARLASAQAAVQAIRLQLAYAVIIAPAAGRVSKRMAEPGQFVRTGQALMAIVNDHDVWVVANLKETQLARVRIGQSAEVRVDAYDGRAIQGHVESIQGATGARFSLLPPDNATGNFTKVIQRVPVKITLDTLPGPPYQLRPGMSVEVAITTDSTAG